MKLKRVPGTTVGRADVNFVLQTQNGVAVGNIIGPALTGKPNTWTYCVMNQVEVGAGSQWTLDQCHREAERVYAEFLNLN
jgi:hypothetical protein